MISIDIMGGFGNQLFQIFATLAYGIQHNIKVVFPFHRHMGHRHTYWDTFFNELVLFTTQNPSNKCSDEDIMNMPIYQEKDFTYLAFPNFDKNSDIRLVGYFQSYKYFDSKQDIIYRLLKLEEKKQNVKTKYANLFDVNGESLSMHFRLGDYKQKRYYHPVLNYEYFEKSLDHVLSRRSQVKRVLYLCESEDNGYVESKIAIFKSKYPEIEYVKVPDEIPDYDQVLVMSLTDHNVMSNSTFSWWGSYLNANPDKIVCYPSVWFGEYYEHTHDNRDMMHESWSKIEAKPISWDKPMI